MVGGDTVKFRGLRPDEIEVRVGTVNKKGVNMLLYKDARCDMNILDETVGAENWQRDHKEIKDNMYAGIGIYNNAIGEWVWKWDCGTESNTEKEKGEASDSFKRAGFNWGIGRELYTGGTIFIPCETVPIDANAPYPKYKLKNQFQFYGVEVLEVQYSEIENKRGISFLVICDKDGKVIFKKGTNHPAHDEPKPDEPSAVELAEIEATKNKKIDKVKLATLEAECLRTGTKKKQVAKTYGVEMLEELNIEQFVQAMEIFGKLPDIKPTQQLAL